MDNQRLMIWAFFGLMAWMTFQAWQQDYAPAPIAAPTQTATPANGGQPDASLPELSPETVNGSDIDAPSVMPAVDAPAVSEPLIAAASIEVQTDVLSITISSQGGTLAGGTLLNYPVAKDRPNELVKLLSADPEQLALLQSGLRSSGDGAEPNHLAMFNSNRDSYELGNSDELVVPLSWTDGNGISVTKTYRFKRGSYIVQLEQTISNNSNSAWRGAEYTQLSRYLREQERSMFDVDSYSFNGPIIYDGEKSEKLQRDDLIDDGTYSFSTDAGWFGAIQHHFVTAVVPSAKRHSVTAYRSVTRTQRPARSAWRGRLRRARATHLRRHCLSARSCSRSSNKLTTN